MAGGALRAMTQDELSAMSQLYWLLEVGYRRRLSFSTGLGLLVGLAIASQSLRAAMLASLREYATLRALGIPLPPCAASFLSNRFGSAVPASPARSS